MKVLSAGWTAVLIFTGRATAVSGTFMILTVSINLV